MDKNNIIVGLAVLLVAGLVVVSVNGAPGKVVSAQTVKTTTALPDTSKGYQDVTLRFKNYEYELSPSTLVKDVPVRMTVDLGSVTRCMRDVVIKQFGVRKYVTQGDNVIEFTPDKAGTIGIACSMNMGRGKFEVVESDGSKGTFVDEAAAAGAAGGSCGAGGGGCGCGG